MEITIGSNNPTKIAAVQAIFPNASVINRNVPSNVSEQPFSDEETRQGAINRAIACIRENPNSIGIGLEGGIMYIREQLYLCNWGALVDQEENVYTASGARILLPSGFQSQLTEGIELGDVMDEYTQKKEVRNNEGAIGIFTNDLVNRKEMFVHVVKLLRGQWEFYNKN
ncbi:DUF84 family protein [Virgibacillus oceani]|uniref:inosine/xanthosine triphosphatase n=1 Tax=Virgibacillus oceani TaxID=1479511 RepID=A0A917M8T9_9BACI|nr:DUF84 family protein [Virgibacillus oceani]GGG84957.1 NTPase [Virgibacillus oceani]